MDVVYNRVGETKTMKKGLRPKTVQIGWPKTSRRGKKMTSC